MSTIQTTTLPNGLRIITDEVKDSHSVAVGIWAGVGTRDEKMEHNGAAHMVEHMLFKGTKKRNALEIVAAGENLGASMNAYTSREITSYHMRGLKDDLPTMIDILADMYQNSTLPDDEIEREREVILQEIGMCHDTPDDLVFDNFYETAYQGQTLGAPILGTANIINAMQKDTLQSHINSFYTPARTVISAAGNLNHDNFVKRVEDLLSDLPANNDIKHEEANYTGGTHRHEKELEQAHFVLGFEGIASTHEDYYNVRTLATLFGGGMSSRLFQEVREKRGLVYSVFSFHSGNLDTGQFGIYAGTGPDKLEEIIPVICDEVVKLADTITEEELNRAKNQLKASLLMGRESMMTRADQQARHTLTRTDKFDPDKLAQKLNNIDIAALQRVAKNIFATKPTLVALGPLSKLENFEKTKERLRA